MLMYTRVYHLDKSKYLDDINLVKDAVKNLRGVSEIRTIDKTNSLIVQFDNRLSEKQILSTINNFKKPIKQKV